MSLAAGSYSVTIMICFGSVNEPLTHILFPVLLVVSGSTILELAPFVWGIGLPYAIRFAVPQFGEFPHGI